MSGPDIASGLLQNDVLQDHFVISNNFAGECTERFKAGTSFQILLGVANAPPQSIEFQDVFFIEFLNA